MYSTNCQHDGGSLKCWGRFSLLGVGNLVFINGNMVGEMYCDMLEQNLVQSVRKLDTDHRRVFQQSNDLKYTVTLWQIG